MATTLDVSCPNCKKGFKVPGEFVGKLIRCKNCQAAFEVQDPSAPRPARPAAAKPARPVAAKPARPAAPAPAKPVAPADPNAPIGFKTEEEEEDPKKPNPYGVAKDDLDIPRCPFCAKELDPPDTKVCLHCGYNLLDRKRAEARVVYELTTGDYILHWLPAVLAILFVIGLLTATAVVTLNMRSWLTGTIVDAETKDPISGSQQFYIHPMCFNVWILVFAAWISYILVRFVIRRLVFNWRPPEVVKKKEAE